MTRARYAARRIEAISNVGVVFPNSHAFREFVVNFDGIGMTVKEINIRLLAYGIHGGADLSEDFPELGHSSLYCVTELSSKGDIDRLVHALTEVTRS